MKKTSKYKSPRFIGLQIKEKRTNKELALLAQSKDCLSLYAVMFKEILDKEIKDMASREVNASVLDISEKLLLIRRNLMEKVRYTTDNLNDVVKEEIQRRKKVKES